MPISVERYLSNLPLIAILRQAPWGFSTKRIFASRGAVGTTFEDVWEGSGNLVYPLAALPVEVVSSDAADTAAGAGAWQVKIDGLDADYKPIDELVLLSGLTPVATTKAFLRVNGAVVMAAGTSGAAVGTLTIQVTGGGDVLSVIPPGPYNTALSSQYTIPANRTAYLIGAKYSSDDQTTRFNLMVRTPGGVFTAVDTFQVGVAPVDPPYFVPIEVTEKSDLKVIARRPTSATSIALVSYDLVLAPKSLSAIRSIGNPAT